MKRFSAAGITLVLLITASCGSTSEGSDPVGDDSRSPTTAPAAGTVEVGAMVDAGPQDLTAVGFVILERQTARLCELLAESFPPQCGGQWVMIENPDKLSVQLETEAGVSWTPDRVEIAGRFDGTRFFVD